MSTVVTPRVGEHVSGSGEALQSLSGLTIGKADLPLQSRLPVFMAQLPATSAVLPYLKQLEQNRIYSNFGPLVLSLQDRLAALFDMERHTVVTTASGSAALVAGILATAGR